MSSPKLVWPVLGLVLAAWAVALGGLASLQANCSADSYMGVRGFNAGIIGCNKIYRYYWCGTALHCCRGAERRRIAVGTYDTKLT
jgi:hypothetical protein